MTISCGLVLQGGGALGAYEWGAVKALVKADFYPSVITGVSIGAINAAAIAGAPYGDISASLDRLWKTITIPTAPMLPVTQQYWLSAFGTPGFYKPRMDFMNALQWTSYCTATPMIKTLTHELDWERLNDDVLHRVCVTATNVGTGMSTRFSNVEHVLTPKHIMASGSLPPGFPGIEIDGQTYWDGGLFDNTPFRPLVDMLMLDEPTRMPIFVIDLFPDADAVPSNLAAVQARTMEIAYENRFWDDFGGPEGLKSYASMLRRLSLALPADSPIFKQEQFIRLMKYRALDNLFVVSAPHTAMSGGMDFSQNTLQRRHDIGYEAMDRYIKEHVFDGQVLVE